MTTLRRDFAVTVCRTDLAEGDSAIEVSGAVVSAAAALEEAGDSAAVDLAASAAAVDFGDSASIAADSTANPWTVCNMEAGSHAMAGWRRMIVGDSGTEGRVFRAERSVRSGTLDVQPDTGRTVCHSIDPISALESMARHGMQVAIATSVFGNHST